MKFGYRIPAIVCSTLLLAATVNAQACYYEGDPVKTASGYDTPKTSSSSTCYYDGDPVMDKSGKYDNPVISYDNGAYYTADFAQSLTYYGSEHNEEFSAFEHEGDTSDSSVLSAAGVTDENAGKNAENEWTPSGWGL